MTLKKITLIAMLVLALALSIQQFQNPPRKPFFCFGAQVLNRFFQLMQGIIDYQLQSKICQNQRHRTRIARPYAFQHNGFFHQNGNRLRNRAFGGPQILGERHWRI